MSRVLSGRIMTNTYLQHLNIIPSSICTCSRATKESIDHLFIACPLATSLWNQLKRQSYPNFLPQSAPLEVGFGNPLGRTALLVHSLFELCGKHGMITFSP
eukprot:TRINITY_DN8756_c5_g1_i1.p1 TRINITY_DN8756_c5_g1~~TRINITY_DN8756_c5_g1_i1.p1  ORF type:complete len:101 (+),score=8.50 TRINITY_DN8756_c5_g1_i1:202-504(+)